MSQRISAVPGSHGMRLQRGQIGLHDEVAVALFPIGDGVARHRLHVDVVGEQIVAAVGFLVGAVEEILGLEALADEASLHVGKAGHDRVDLAGADRLLQLLQCQNAGHAGFLPLSNFRPRGV